MWSNSSTYLPISQDQAVPSRDSPSPPQDMMMNFAMFENVQPRVETKESYPGILGGADELVEDLFQKLESQETELQEFPISEASESDPEMYDGVEVKLDHRQNGMRTIGMQNFEGGSQTVPQDSSSVPVYGDHFVSQPSPASSSHEQPITNDCMMIGQSHIPPNPQAEAQMMMPSDQQTTNQNCMLQQMQAGTLAENQIYYIPEDSEIDTQLFSELADPQLSYQSFQKHDSPLACQLSPQASSLISNESNFSLSSQLSPESQLPPDTDSQLLQFMMSPDPDRNSPPVPDESSHLPQACTEDSRMDLAAFLDQFGKDLKEEDDMQWIPSPQDAHSHGISSAPSDSLDDLCLAEVSDADKLSIDVINSVERWLESGHTEQPRQENVPALNLLLGEEFHGKCENSGTMILPDDRNNLINKDATISGPARVARGRISPSVNDANSLYSDSSSEAGKDSDPDYMEGVAGLSLEDGRVQGDGGSVKRSRRKTPKLWNFLLDCLCDPRHNNYIIGWVDKRQGRFKILDTKELANLWGQRQGKTKKAGAKHNMTYEKMSRAMRYHYGQKVLISVPDRLTYQFGPNAKGWKKRAFNTTN